MLLVSNFHLSLIFQENKMQANHICLYIHNLHIHTRMCPHPHAYTYIYMCPCWHTQLCLTVCGPMDYCLSGSSVHGILQARVLEWVAILFSRGSSWSRDQMWVSCISCIGRQVLYQLSHQRSPMSTSDQIRSDQSLSRVRVFATPWIAIDLFYFQVSLCHRLNRAPKSNMWTS